VCCALTTSPVWAQASSPTIAATSQSADGSTLFIQGDNFGASPSVSFGGFPLGGVIVDALGTTITVPMPVAAPGTYQLVVASKRNHSAAFEITLGATGPAGPAGPAGAAGPTGPQGADGAIGPQGPPGPAGPMGVTGATGSAGLQGPSGVVGHATGSGAGNNPDGNLQFLAQPVAVTLAAGQHAFVISHRALGTVAVAGAGNLNLFICFEPAAGGAPSTIGSGLYGLRVAANTRLDFGLSTIATMPAGSYTVGLCGYTADGNANWNNNEFSYTSALVFQ
jgi:hypothetical protein